MSGPYLRFTNGALRVKGITRVEFQEPPPQRVVQTVTIPVAPEPVPEPVVVPEPEPVLAPVPEPVVVPEPEPVQVAEVPVSEVEAPAEVLEASPESGLVPEDPPAE